MENNPQSSYSWQTFSIFLSSTFADMHAERDYLKNVVFPKLDEELSKRKIKLEIVDLRWGVNTESSEKEDERERNILNVCLDEIERCHPFFIGLLGDRYGWVPDAEGKRITEVSAGKSLLLTNKGKSVTALEIEFGVLVNPEQIKRSMFYFREPMDYSKFNPEKAALYCEEFDPKLTPDEKEERRTSLENLKKIISEHFKKIGLSENVTPYYAKWDEKTQKVIGLKEWGDKVYKDVLVECENQAKDTWDILPKNWHEQEFALLEAFIKSHIGTFCGRKLLLQELKNHLLGSNKNNWGLVLTGESGSGKSAVFSMICEGMKKENCFILAHSAGLSPRSRNIMDLLQIWNKQLGDFLGIELIEEKSPEGQEGIRKLQLEAFSQTEEKKTGIEKVQDEFRELLFMAAHRKAIVILIDALDRFEPTERAKYMTWLPVSLPENVRVLCTAVTGTEQKAVEYHKNLNVRSIDLFSKEDANEMIVAMCKENRKTLNEAIVQTILQKERDEKFPAASSPLWLNLSLKSLLVLDQDDFEKIYMEEGKKRMEGEKVEAALENYMKKMAEDFPPLPGNLFLHLLIKATSVFGKEFTYTVFDYIACSRNGLRESDLEKLFKEKEGLQWDALLFANLRRWFKGYLQEQGYDAQWNLNHSILRNTVLEKMDKEKNRSIHQSIANHFQQLPPVDPLRISETMYHLMRADNAEQAVDYYIDELSKEEVEACTKVLAETIAENKEGMQWAFTMIEVSNNEKLFYLAERFVSSLENKLIDKGRLSESLELLKILKETIELRGNSEFIIAQGFESGFGMLLLKLGLINSQLGNVEHALSFYEEGINFFKEANNSNQPNDERIHLSALPYLSLAELYLTLGDLERALKFSEKLNRCFEDLTHSDPSNKQYKYFLAGSFLLLGIIDFKKNNLEKALLYYEKSKRLTEMLYESDPRIEDYKIILGMSYDCLSLAYRISGNFENALVLSEKVYYISLELYESSPQNIYFKYSLALSSGNLAKAYKMKNSFLKSLEFSKDSNRLILELNYSNPQNITFMRYLAASYEWLGIIYYAMVIKAKYRSEKERDTDRDKAILYFHLAEKHWKELVDTFPDYYEFKQILNKLKKYLKKNSNKYFLFNLFFLLMWFGFTYLGMYFMKEWKSMDFLYYLALLFLLISAIFVIPAFKELIKKSPWRS
jgi:tetratricopeptide (TPR) repeat protein